MWELIFMLLILKIPMVWIGWVVWWSVRAEPEVAPGGGAAEAEWQPFRPSGPARRGRRGGPHGSPTRAGRMRRRERAGA
ncbi:MAG TPA: hypothetical protein VL977_04360 [Solirubrobacteraceae bacterium]|nr:hypothetical protein [Solirubrobacteraceae bacterium]